jgi:TetR/AcrR family transcriptional regulator, transcriptional repressor for nem operon
MNDQVDPGQATRTRIVLAAMELFWEKGYQSTSVADLLKQADVHSGSLYHFFPGKQDVLIAVLDMYWRGIDEILVDPVWKDVDDPIERVFALLAKYRELIVQTDCTYGCPIGSLALELHEPDPPVRELLAANFSAWVDRIERCLVDAGPRLPRSANRRALAGFVLTTMEGGVMLARTYRNVAAFDAAIDQLRRYFRCLLDEAGARKRRRKPTRR